MPVIRKAETADAAACAEIYAPYVRETPISFEASPPTVDEMADRIARYGASHEWIVAIEGERVVGYAYAAPYSPRDAYAWTAETSVYLAPGTGGAGLGSALYTELLDRLAARGFRRAIAGIVVPNDASVRLHRRLGFRDVGVLERVGWKLNRWWDVLRMQRDLGGDDAPRPVSRG
ncbi:GNAT family N-acetyltransferase [Microbacterium sp. Marseille-Q6965]|uniref:GNAT family N-acetyltransferase n=1 Tax=Microbacterium sp. Marseille-Q6965 TaxID=2965072 RepID=UPI0021B75711|nr:GNAT family N-acetyltransferase [Microbacterium sp. Marseille-Q6965]